MNLWDFKSGERNEILHWARELSSRDRAALNQKLDMLQKVEFGQAIGLKLLNGPLKDTLHILKLRAKADTAMRPLLCRGPQAPLLEYTLLKGALERDSKLQPRGVVEAAMRNRDCVHSDLNKRTRHERA